MWLHNIFIFYTAILSSGCYDWAIIDISEDGIGAVVFARVSWLRIATVVVLLVWCRSHISAKGLSYRSATRQTYR